MSGKLADKVAIITGGAKGIGVGIVNRFVAEGARVLIADSDPGMAEETAKASGAAADYIDVAEVDVRDITAVNAAVAQAVSKWGRIDILVNNAGVMDRQPFLEMTEELWDKVLDINLKGSFRFSQAVARQMVSQGDGGRIVNVASNSGMFGGKGRAAYGASKAGVINLTQSMAIELAEHGIIVNAVAPGPTKSGPHIPDVLASSVADRMPLQRYGTIEEIAAVAAFLASDECSFTTGHTWAADGGFTISGMMEG